MSKSFPLGWTRQRQLGEGGQAQVFAATRDGDDSGAQFAIKLLKRNAKPAHYERFVQEVKTIQKLNHHAIVKVVAFSQPDDEAQFYAMEYVDGAKSLAQLLAKPENPFAGDEFKSIRMFIRILEALEHCRSAGVVHRDLSPANVLVLPGEGIKIIDFGLCQLDAGQPPISLTGDNVGTPNYMAPECENHGTAPITFCADLYSVAKIMWAAMVNQPAFAREQRVFGDLSIQKQFPHQPNAWHLQHIFENSIRHDVKDRWATADRALAGAWNVHHAIDSKTLPFDLLIHRCPACYVGELTDPAQTDFPGGAYLLFGQGNSECVRRVCKHCGYCFMVNARIRQRTVDRRAQLR